ncbi:taste receptor type 2 member 140-like [Chionomys nivalis]|uniref:taste receptor type 2 member 140-like n=1 Tax=Chionomys nivalis TaxID=269649 RepID=UPI002595C239|nr:taste receptor type 2 member 140-like [Chionomys nivalis]
MKVIVEYLLLIILGVEIIIGSFGNGFIILMNIMDWDKRRKISTVNKIFTALAISRLAFVWSLVMVLLIYELYPSFMISGKILRISNFSWTVVNHFNIWLATCLSIFYFLKIASFSNSFFLFLKWRAKKVVSMTLLVSLLFLFINLVVINAYVVVWIDGAKSNMSYSFDSNDYEHFSRFLTLTNTMFTFIPFIVSLTTLLLLIFSLWRHLKNMQHNTKGYRDPSTTAHIKALQMVVTFLSLYTIFFLALVMQSLKNDIHLKSLINLIFDDVAFAFPSGHSCVIIFGNTKLRQAFLSMTWWLSFEATGFTPQPAADAAVSSSQQDLFVRSLFAVLRVAVEAALHGRG